MGAATPWPQRVRADRAREVHPMERFDAMEPFEANGRDVLVVGAGLAGLACASALAERGGRGLVLDKGRGPGGRLSTRRRTDAEGRALAFDHGAQYFTVRDAAFARQVERWCARGVAAPWPARVITLAAGVAGEPRGSGGAGGPVGAGGSDGATERFVGTPAMQSLAVDLADELQRGGRFRLVQSARVEALRATANGVVAHLAGDLGGDLGDDRAVGPFLRVCVALPAPQARDLVATLGADAAPLVATAEGVAMEPSLAALVRFAERPRTSDGAAFDGAFVESDALSWVARDASKPGRPDAECWVLHATPRFARASWDDDPARWSDALVEAFGAALGRPAPAVTWRDTHRWGFALAPAPLEPGSGAPPLVASVGPATVALAGDWCCGSRVEGAWLGGRAAADRLAGGVSG